MPDGQRHLGGLWCGDVLALLPDLVDGTLDDARLTAVHAHVAGCDWCARFGGEYAEVVAGLRAGLAPEVAPDVADRLDRALADALK